MLTYGSLKWKVLHLKTNCHKELVNSLKYQAFAQQKIPKKVLEYSYNYKALQLTKNAHDRIVYSLQYKVLKNPQVFIREKQSTQ